MGINLWTTRRLEKCLVWLYLLLLCNSVLGSIILREITPPRSAEVIRPCTTDYCKSLAETIMSYMNESVDPCTDFYKYACGGWLKTHHLPRGRFMHTPLYQIGTESKKIVKELLESPTNAKSEAERKAQIFHKSCTDEATIESLAGKPLINFIETVGGWNISGKFVSKNWPLQKKMQILQNRYGLPCFFHWKIIADPMHGSNHVMAIDEDPTILPKKKDVKKMDYKVMSMVYLDLATKLGVLLGGEEESTRMQMKDVLELEQELTEILPEGEYEQQYITLNELQKISPFISWVDFFQDAANLVSRKVNGSMIVTTEATKYFMDLTKLINTYSKTNRGKVALHNYLILSAARRLHPLLATAFKEVYMDFTESYSASDRRIASCVFSNPFTYAVSAMYVRKVFNVNAKSMVTDMARNVRNAFVENLQKSNWVDEETKKVVREKASAMKFLIAFPNYILNPEDVDLYYEDVTVKPNEFFNNTLNMLKHKIKRNIALLGTPVNRNRWHFDPIDANAFFDELRNQMVVPVGIIRVPMFNENYPSSVNYGKLGTIIGHEITHGFDDLGQQYDLNGNYKPWWTNSTIRKFKKKSECFINQYSAYEIRGQHADGERTLGENMSDNGGLHAAFEAYIASLKNNDNIEPLPGLGLNHRQLFFLSYAQIWCTKATYKGIEYLLSSDTHSPGKLRVILPLSNSKDFAREYNCPLGSNMNPVEKCEIW